MSLILIKLIKMESRKCPWNDKRHHREKLVNFSYICGRLLSPESRHDDDRPHDKVGSIYFVWPPSLGLSSLDDRSLNINHKERLYFPSRHCPVWPKNLSTSWYDSLKHFGSQGQEKANRGRAQTAPTERQPDTTSGTAFESRTQCAASSVDQWPIEIGSGLLPR